MALQQIDSYQPRSRYSRCTMPDVYTTSLQSLQNPLKRQQPIPCLRDQHTLSTDSKLYFSQERGFLEQKKGYEKQAMEAAKRFEAAANATMKPHHKYVSCPIRASCNQNKPEICLKSKLDDRSITENIALDNIPELSNDSTVNEIHTAGNENAYDYGDQCSALRQSNPTEIKVEESSKTCIPQPTALWSGDSTSTELEPSKLLAAYQKLPQTQRRGNLTSKSSCKKLLRNPQNVKTVTWVDQTNKNTNNNEDNCEVKSGRQERIYKSKIKTQGCVNNIYTPHKSGRYDNYLNMNSQAYQSDISTDYDQGKSNVTCRITDRATMDGTSHNYNGR